MSKVCQVTGKRPQTGNNVSHAHNKTRRRFLPNLQSKRFWLESEKRFVRLRVSAAGMRIIDKKGIDAVLGEMPADRLAGHFHDTSGRALDNVEAAPQLVLPLPTALLTQSDLRELPGGLRPLPGRVR